MTKFTRQENAIRKEVFNYNRRRNSWEDSCTKKFGKSKAVRQAIIDSNRRMESHGQTLSEHQCFLYSLTDKADAMARCLPSAGYSMGDYKRITNRLYGELAGNEGYHRDQIGFYDNTQEYRGGKWKANHGEVQVELPVGLIAKGEVLEGMITIRTKQIQKRIWKCQWVAWDYERNKRGFITTAEIKWHMEEGYVAQCPDRYSKEEFRWYHCSDLATARKGLANAVSARKIETEKRRQEAAARRAEKEEEKRKQKEQEKADRIERQTVMAHSKHYTQREVQRAAWKIFGKIASRQESCLFTYWYVGKCRYKLTLNEGDAFERDVKKAFDAICEKHDAISELSKHNRRAKAAKYWSERPANILHHELVVNYPQATQIDEDRHRMSLPGDVIYAYNDRDKRILKILAKMYRRQFAEQQEVVAKSSELADGLQHMYVYRDSIAAGNCVPGTDGFIADHGLKKTDTRSGEFLLRISRGSWQHANVARIVERYIQETYPDFYQRNRRGISSVLSIL